MFTGLVYHSSGPVGYKFVRRRFKDGTPDPKAVVLPGPIPARNFGFFTEKFDIDNQAPFRYLDEIAFVELMPQFACPSCPVVSTRRSSLSEKGSSKSDVGPVTV